MVGSHAAVGRVHVVHDMQSQVQDCCSIAATGASPACIGFPGICTLQLEPQKKGGL